MVSLPTWGSLSGTVNLVVGAGGKTGIYAGARIRRLELPPEHVDRSGVPYTIPARTWMDVTRRAHLADSLVLGDALLAREMARLEDLRHMAAFAEVARLPGRRRVRAAIDLIDPVRESPLESSSVAYFVRYAVPLPKAQVEIYDERGLFVARVDFLWENPVTGVRVVGEADGQGKYGRSQDLYQEKRREDALRALGFVVIRWGTQDLRDAQLAARIITGLAG